MMSEWQKSNVLLGLHIFLFIAGSNDFILWLSAPKLIYTGKTLSHSPDTGLDLGLVTKSCSEVTRDTVAIIFTEQFGRRKRVAVQYCETLPGDSQLKSLVANCFADSRANALLRHRECQSLSRVPSVLDRISPCGMPAHAMEGFEQKEKSGCGTASHGSSALSLCRHISHLKSQTGEGCTSQAHWHSKHVFLSASRVRQNILFPPSSSCFPVQRAKVGYTQ